MPYGDTADQAEKTSRPVRSTGVVAVTGADRSAAGDHARLAGEGVGEPVVEVDQAPVLAVLDHGPAVGDLAGGGRHQDAVAQHVAVHAGGEGVALEDVLDGEDG